MSKAIIIKDSFGFLVAFEGELYPFGSVRTATIGARSLENGDTEWAKWRDASIEQHYGVALRGHEGEAG